MDAAAAWRHVEAREGFEVVFPRTAGDRRRFEGHATAVEAGEAWSVRYRIEVDADWVTRSAHVRGWSAAGEHEVWIQADGGGAWLVDGRPAPALDGCLDVDLEASAFTNTFPMNRLALRPGEAAEAPAAWVRVPALEVERLEQRYERIEDRRYAYAAPDLDFRCLLSYDEDGLTQDYPGLAVRVAR